MLTKENLINLLKQKQHLFTPDCVSIAQDRYFAKNKVKYTLFIFKCEKHQLYIDETSSDSSRWWQNGKSSLDDVFIGGLSFETEEYECGFENCTFNLNELLGEQE